LYLCVWRPLNKSSQRHLLRLGTLKNHDLRQDLKPCLLMSLSSQSSVQTECRSTQMMPMSGSCDFLLVRHSNFVTLVLFCTVSEILQVFCAHAFSTLIFVVFPLDQIAHVRVNVSRYLKLFGREIIFEVFQPILSRYLNVTDGQMDGPVA